MNKFSKKLLIISSILGIITNPSNVFSMKTDKNQVPSIRRRYQLKNKENVYKKKVGIDSRIYTKLNTNTNRLFKNNKLKEVNNQVDRNTVVDANGTKQVSKTNQSSTNENTHIQRVSTFKNIISKKIENKNVKKSLSERVLNISEINNINKKDKNIKNLGGNCIFKEKSVIENKNLNKIVDLSKNSPYKNKFIHIPTNIMKGDAPEEEKYWKQDERNIIKFIYWRNKMCGQISILNMIMNPAFAENVKYALKDKGCSDNPEMKDSLETMDAIWSKFNSEDHPCIDMKDLRDPECLWNHFRLESFEERKKDPLKHKDQISIDALIGLYGAKLNVGGAFDEDLKNKDSIFTPIFLDSNDDEKLLEKKDGFKFSGFVCGTPGHHWYVHCLYDSKGEICGGLKLDSGNPIGLKRGYKYPPEEYNYLSKYCSFIRKETVESILKQGYLEFNSGTPNKFRCVLNYTLQISDQKFDDYSYYWNIDSLPLLKEAIKNVK